MTGSHASTGPRTGAERAHAARGRLAAALVLVFACLALPAAPSARAEVAAELVAEDRDGFGRLVFTFADMPKYDLHVSTGVLVLSFEDPVRMKTAVDKLPTDFGSYIGAARLDPDRRAVRFALAQKVTINAMEAGEKLFLDFLPADWSGLPPSLPEEVIAELARRAKEADERLREETLRRAGLLKIAQVGLSAGEHPTFSRLSFQWDRTIDAKLARDGDEVTIRFPHKGHVALDEVGRHPPRFVRSVRQELTEEGLVVRLEVLRSASVRAFSEEKTYVVDVTGSADLLDREAQIGQLDPEPAGAPALPPSAGPAIEIAGVPERPQAVVTPAQAAAPVAARVVPFDPASVAPAAFADWAGPAPVLDVSVRKSPQQADREDKIDFAKQPAAVGDPVRVGDLGAASVAVLAGDAQHGETVRVQATRIGKSVRLTFPFARPVASSVFARADTIWIVFDTLQPIDARGLAGELSDRLANVSVGRRDEVQFVRLTLSRPGIATVTAEQSLWSVTIGDLVLEPTEPLALQRGFGPDGQPQVTVDLPDAGKVHRIDDPALGDTLVVVTAYGPARGLVKTQDFVQFSALASSHGLAFKPVADDLLVLLDDNRVKIGRGAGLWISAGSVRQYLPGRQELFDGRRPGFIDFVGIRAPGPAKFVAARQQLELRAATAEESSRNAAGLTLARFLVGNSLAAEALGVLENLRRRDEEIVRDPLFNATRGIASVLMGRPLKATADFAVHGLSQSRDIALWRALVDAAAGNWRDAQGRIAAAEEVIPAYPPDLQARFRLTGIRAALRNGDLAEAGHHLQQLRSLAAGDAVVAETELVAAMLDEARGHHGDALNGYLRVMARDVRPVAAEARLREIALLRRLGRLDTAATVEALETLTAVWRGDEIELAARRILARALTEKGNYRRAFEMIGMAMFVDPNSEITRHIQSDMTAAFEDLFLHGKSDEMSPIEAVSLFYDYRDLTPIGRLGDEMIRKLSDRLIEVDLLDQAAELLAHQVEQRLQGAARAQVGARLAFVHMLAGQPAKALDAIQRTRIASLPVAVQRQRDLLEARALAETNRVELALDLLDTMHGDDIVRARAEALWLGRRWQEAAETLERLLGNAWTGDTLLSREQRFDVMRAAIAYSLAEDQLGLDRLRSKFADKMSDGPDAHSFAVVTQPIHEKGAEFGSLVRSIAATDSLKAFLGEFRRKYGNGGAPAEISAAPQG